MVRAPLVAAIAAAAQFASPALLSAEESGRPALTIEIDGAIGPATVRYVKEALTTAGERRGGALFPPLKTTRRPPPPHPAHNPPRRRCQHSLTLCVGPTRGPPSGR